MTPGKPGWFRLQFDDGDVADRQVSIFEGWDGQDWQPLIDPENGKVGKKADKSAASKLVDATRKGLPKPFNDALQEVFAVEQGEALIDALSDALVTAAGYGKKALVNALLNSYADPTSCRPRHDGRNALHEACSWKDGQEIIQMLLDKRADPAKRTENKKNATAWGMAKKNQATNLSLLPPEPEDLAEDRAPGTSSGSKTPAPTSRKKAKGNWGFLPFQLSPECATHLLDFQRAHSQPLGFEIQADAAAPNSASSTAVPQANLTLPRSRLLNWCAPGLGPTFWADKEARTYASRRTRPCVQLPITGYREEILQVIRDNPVVVLRGETGSGKSTQVPQFILDSCQHSAAHIIVSQPRRLAAVSLASRVASERGEEVGGPSVGYHIGGEEVLPSDPDHSIVYCTEGALLRRLRRGSEGVSHFIIDEAHERSVDCDLLLCILRNLMNQHCHSGSRHGAAPRLIVMSATVDVERFKEYFRNPPHWISKDLQIPGSTFPVETQFLEDVLELVGQDALVKRRRGHLPFGAWSLTNSNLGWECPEDQHYSLATQAMVRKLDERYVQLDVATALVRKRISDGLEGAILFFLPGRAEIAQAHRWLVDDPVLAESCMIVELHSTCTKEVRNQAFASAPWGKTKVVLTTNVAETSLTIPDVVCVIDSGLVRISDELAGALRTVWEGKSNVAQRRGRAGRVSPGTFFALFTRARYELLDERVPPEMGRCHLARLILLVLQMGQSPMSLLRDTLDPPADENIQKAQAELEELRAIRMVDDVPVLTDLGRVLEALPAEPRLGLSLVASLLAGLHEQMALVVAVIAAQQYFFRSDMPSGASNLLDHHKKDLDMLFESDILAAVLALTYFRAADHDARQQLCFDNGWEAHALQQTSVMSDQLLEAVGRLYLSEGETDQSRDPSIGTTQSMVDKWPLLSWLLALGLGHQPAIHLGNGKLRIGSQHGRTVRESVWADVLQEDMQPEILLYGRLLPITDGGGGNRCCDVTPVPMLSLMLGATSRERSEYHGGPGRRLTLSKWLVVDTEKEDLDLIQWVASAHFELMESVAAGLQQNRFTRVSVKSQFEMDDDRGNRIRAWRHCLQSLAILSCPPPSSSQSPVFPAGHGGPQPSADDEVVDV